MRRFYFLFIVAVFIIGSKAAALDLISNTAYTVGKNQITFAGGFPMKFYKSGKVENGYLAWTTNIDSLRFTNDYISFYESGKVMSGMLAKPVILDNVGYSNRQIIFYESGKVWKGTALIPVPYRGMEFEREVYFYESGKFQSGYVTQPVKINGIDFEGKLEFYENGNLLSGFISGKTNINGLPVKWVSYFPSGKISRVQLSVSAIISNIKFTNDFVYFYETGTVESGYLAEDTTIGTNKFKAYEWITLDKTGKITNIPLKSYDLDN